MKPTLRITRFTDEFAASDENLFYPNNKLVLVVIQFSERTPFPFTELTGIADTMTPAVRHSYTVAFDLDTAKEYPESLFLDVPSVVIDRLWDASNVASEKMFIADPRPWFHEHVDLERSDAVFDGDPFVKLVAMTDEEFRAREAEIVQ